MFESKLRKNAVWVTLGLWTLAGVSCSRPTGSTDSGQQASTKPVAMTVPPGLEEAGNLGEDLYDAAHAGDWAQASGKFESLKTVVGGLQSSVAGQNDLTDKLAGLVAKLGIEVGAKNGRAVTQSANEVTRVVAEWTRAYAPAVPVEVTLLDYYGREMEIAKNEASSERQASVAKDIERTWDVLKPKVAAKGANDVLRRFDQLVEKIAKANGHSGQFATQLLNEVDSLEKVFKP